MEKQVQIKMVITIITQCIIKTRILLEFSGVDDGVLMSEEDADESSCC